MKNEIFIIDDDPIYRLIVTKMIDNIDSSLIINHCENGEIGLDKLKNLKNSNHNIIVFLDINMPILDGWSFLEEIERSNFYNPNRLTIYIVSSSTDERDLLKSKNYQYLNGFYHKPLTIANIKTIIGIT